jgi:hypothetical protein
MRHWYYFLLTFCGLFFIACDDPDPDGTKPDKPKPDPDPVTGNYYVSPTGSDENNNGRYSAFPFKTIGKALSVVKPGDVVNIMPGVYTAGGKPLIELLPGHSGAEEKYITIKAFDPADMPVLFAAGENIWNAVSINASYIVIDGLELAGNNANIDSLAAYNNARLHYDKGTMDWAKTAAFNTNGLTVGGSGQNSERPHHVIVRNCKVHDFPGGGLNLQQADYVTFENNVVYNNAWYTMYGCSGISTLTPLDNDNNTGYKIIIRNNICYNNKTKIPWSGTANFTLSDGNGIIIDVNNRPDTGGVAPNAGPYMGRTLVENNISFNNGGSGIHSFKANHVDMINNTAYHNMTKFDSGYAEIWTNQCQDVNIVNNIMYARAGGNCNMKTNHASEVYRNNIYFNGKVNTTTGANDKTADPLFVNPSRDGLVADFHLKAGSPAIGHGTRTDYMSGADRDGTPRSDRVDAGAYQHK